MPTVHNTSAVSHAIISTLCLLLFAATFTFLPIADATAAENVLCHSASVNNASGSYRCAPNTTACTVSCFKNPDIGQGWVIFRDTNTSDGSFRTSVKFEFPANSSVSSAGLVYGDLDFSDPTAEFILIFMQFQQSGTCRFGHALYRNGTIDADQFPITPFTMTSNTSYQMQISAKENNYFVSIQGDTLPSNFTYSFNATTFPSRAYGVYAEAGTATFHAFEYETPYPPQTEIPTTAPSVPPTASPVPIARRITTTVGGSSTGSNMYKSLLLRVMIAAICIIGFILLSRHYYSCA